MRVLLSNDDGVHSAGLAALAAAFEGDEVWVVAPDREQSASSHSISLHRPLRMVELEHNCRCYELLLGTDAQNDRTFVN